MKAKVTPEAVLGWLKEAWDATYFPKQEAFYPDAFKCRTIAEFLNYIARSEAKPARPKPVLPAMIEHGRKFLKSLPAQRKAIEAERARVATDADYAYRDVLTAEHDEILADLLRVEQAMKATLAHWGLPDHKPNPAHFVSQKVKYAWKETIRQQHFSGCIQRLRLRRSRCRLTKEVPWSRS
jgi:hypothetical protein